MTLQLFLWKGGQKIATILSGPHPFGDNQYRFEIDRPVIEDDELLVHSEDASAAVMRILSSDYQYQGGVHFINVVELAYGTEA
jgi:hypothetical protein